MKQNASALPLDLEHLTIGQVCDVLRDAESHVWDEYLSVMEHADTARPWPTSYRWVGVYVVTGGSEGHYLHIDILERQVSGGSRVEHRRLLILGKCLGDATWAQMWESAGRIAAMLSA